MADISAKDVMELRKKTGCGMMECKKALVSAEGNFEEATKLLREKGLAVAAKKADRIAAEGVVDVMSCKECGYTAMVEVNSETDFVAKNAIFREFVSGLLKTILKTKPADIAALMNEKFLDTEHTVEATLKNQVFTTGENLSIRRFVLVDGITGTYVHGGGVAGVVAKFTCTNGIENKPEFAEFAKNICMQIAAMGPSYVCPGYVPADVLANEKEIIATQIKNDESNAKKPAAIIEKMVNGKISKFYESACLLEQAYVKDDGIKVSKYVENVGKELGGEIDVVSFVKYERGEGIEKKEEDFASEIEKMVKG